MPARQEGNFDPPGYSDCSREKILVQWVLSGHLGAAKHGVDTDFGHLKYLFPSAVEHIFSREHSWSPNFTLAEPASRRQFVIVGSQYKLRFGLGEIYAFS